MLTVWVLVGCTTEEAVPVGSRLVYGLAYETAILDPHRVGDGAEAQQIGAVLRQMYDTLLYRDPQTGDFVPGLASEWAVTPDGLVYTFTLRQGVTFHDGTGFDAASVAANLDRIINPEFGSVKARSLLGPYAGYQIVDPYTIQIVLSEAYAPLLDGLSQFYLSMASPTTFGQYSPARYQFHQAGTGPYQLVEYTPGSRIVIRRNPNYTWGPPFYLADNAAAPDEIEYRFVREARVDALEASTVALVGEIAPSDVRRLAGNSQLRLLPVTVPGLPVHFMLNTALFPTDNPTIRQALLHATNRSAITNTVYQGFAPVAWGPLSARNLFYTRQVVGIYDFDLQQASALLSTLGLVDNDGNGFLDVAGEDLSVTMLVPSVGQFPQIAQLLQAQWRAIGVEVVIRQVAGMNALREAVESGDYNLVAYFAPGYDPSILNDVFLSTGAYNYSNYNSPDLDNALIAAAQELDPERRRQLYAQIQQFIMLEALILPISDYVSLIGVETRIDNLQFDVYGWFPLMQNVRLS
ncbi:MAG: ABC transporter substrate-binding protein [Anaerolineae bacterium]